MTSLPMLDFLLRYKGILIPTVLAILSLILLYRYLTRNNGVFERLGIPGPKPLPIFGNLSFGGKNIMDQDMELKQKYGNLVGTFSGSTPELVVFDVDWIKEAFIKNFSKTSNRRQMSLGALLDRALFSLPGDEHWKHVRTMMSMSFTQGKLKKMVPCINRCCSVLTKKLDDSEGSSLGVKRFMDAFTADVIAATTFGIEADSQTNPNSEFLLNSLRVVEPFEKTEGILQKIRLYAAIIVIMIAPKFVTNFLEAAFDFTFHDRNALRYLQTLCDNIIDDKSQSKDSSNLIGSFCEKFIDLSKDDPSRLADSAGFLWSRKGLTREDITSNGISVIFGTQTNISTNLSYLLFELAHNPEVQEKAHQMIEETCQNEETSIEEVNKLSYIEWCLNEVMRLYPTTNRTDRVVCEDLTVQGMTIPKGTIITAGIYVIHKDPELWSDPEKFYPERFSPEQNPSGPPSMFMGFGIGNRICPGSRLALLIMKIVTINILKSYRIEKTEETPTRPLKFKDAGILPSPIYPIALKFSRRY